MEKCKTIAVCNQKGGVAKTTTVVNLGIGLAMYGKKTLIVDFDAQADATASLGWRNSDELPVTITTKLTQTMNGTLNNPFEGILHHEENVDLMPANIELSAMEMNLVNAFSREILLKTYLNEIKGKYDFILIDCMPSLSILTINALSAADSVIIPVQSQYLPAKGMTQLLQTIGRVKKYINPDINIDGILLTLVDNRTNLARITAETLKNNFGNHIKLYKTTIPIGVKAAEASAAGKSIFAYDPSSTVAKAYKSLTEEVIADVRKKERNHAPDFNIR